VSENGKVAAPTQHELTLALAGAMDETAARAVEHAEAMRRTGERLYAEAARLEEAATKLLAGAEAVGRVGGESEDEVAEIADYGTTVNTRGERIDYPACIRVAQGLGRFGRGEFADGLCLKPLVASRWLARLREQGALDVEDDDGSVTYVFVKPEGGSPPRPRTEPEPLPEVPERAGPGSGNVLTRHKATADLVKEIKHLGGSVSEGKGGHLHVSGPRGRCSIAKTPGGSDLRKTRANVRRLTGLQVAGS
jgi:hypothetical protein